MPLILLHWMFQRVEKRKTKFDRIANIVPTISIREEEQHEQLKMGSKPRNLNFPWWFKLALYLLTFIGFIVAILLSILEGINIVHKEYIYPEM